MWKRGERRRDKSCIEWRSGMAWKSKREMLKHEEKKKTMQGKTEERERKIKKERKRRRVTTK